MIKSVIILVVLITPHVLFSIDLEDTIIFKKSTWNIAIEELSGNLSSNNSYLKNSIPDLIVNELESSDMHVLSSDEIRDYQKRLIEEKKILIIEELREHYINRDKLLFESNLQDSSSDEFEKNILELKDSLLELAFLDSDDLKTADMLSVKWIASDDDNKTLQAGQYVPSVVLKKYDLDFLIKGSIKEIDEYFLIELSGYSQAGSELFSIYSDVGSIDDVERIAKAAANEIRSIILGRPWAILVINTDNPDALIYSDGVLVGVGKAEIKTMEPGLVFLEAIGDDNSYWSSEVDLKALEINSFEGELSENDAELISLNTEPAEADVYIGARWAGQTPLKLPRYDNRNIWVTIKSDGFYDKSFEVSSDSSLELFFNLEEEEMTRLEQFDMKKKEFYKSLGWFSLSVAAPVVSGGIYSNFADRQNAYAFAYGSDSALAKEMERNYYITYGVFWGTIGVSGGLLVDLFVKLSRYIKAAEALAE